MGWEQNFLQQAVDTCTSPSGEIEDCPIFNIQSEATQNQCKMKMPSAAANEKVTGKIGMSLPGDVLIQYGPGPATAKTQPSPISPVVAPTASPPAATGLPGQVFLTKTSSTPAAAVTAPPALNQQVSK